MREVLAELLEWWRAGEPVGMATVVGTWRSAPRPPGATMLVGPDGSVVGSVSGGCVEAAVYDLGQAAIASGEPVLARYGVSDDSAFEVGLTCGGTIEIFVQRVDQDSWPELAELAASVAADEPVATATVIKDAAGPGAAGPDAGGRVGRRLLVWPDRHAGTLGAPGVPGRRAESGDGAGLEQAVLADTRGALAAGHTGPVSYGPDGERLGEAVTVFVSALAPPPRMIVFGAIDFAAAVARIGTFLGYRVTVCDARPVFATGRRFPGVEVVVDWPHRYLAGEVAGGRLDRRTVVCVLTHDPKFDVPALAVALPEDLAYVGAMGSRRTHADRVLRLRAAGVTDEQLAKLASPIGLDLGARTPEETAVSVAAEIISRRWGGGGQPLSLLDGSIHQHLDRT